MEQLWQLILIPAIGYLFLQNSQHSKMLAVLNSTVTRLEIKMDLFLKTEIDTLKEIAKK